MDKYSTTVFLLKNNGILLHTYCWSSWLASSSQWHAVKFMRAFNDQNNIFSIVRVCRKRVSNRISYCVCELLPFCTFSLYATHNATDSWSVSNDLCDQCRNNCNLQNKMAPWRLLFIQLKIVLVSISPSTQRRNLFTEMFKKDNDAWKLN